MRISTHDLARRSTSVLIFFVLCTCISTHDLARRSTRRLRMHRVRNYISTHDLARRSTYSNRRFRILESFQLTTSQGGRRDFRASVTKYGNFNSRPRKEVDDRGTFLPRSFRYFNSRPRKEVDRDNAKLCRVHNAISTHDLARRSTQFQFPSYHTPIISTHDLARRSTLLSFL